MRIGRRAALGEMGCGAVYIQTRMYVVFLSTESRSARMVRRTKAEALATRTALLDAAERLFQQRGVSRTSLQDIAVAAGVTRGAVYWHFQDKADLFNAMMQRVSLPLEESADQLEACDAHQPLDRLRQLLNMVIGRVATDEQVHRVFEIATHKVEYVEELRTVQQRHQQAVEEHLLVIGRCLQRAGLDTRDALGLHALVVGLIHTWMLDPAAFDLATEGRRAIDAHLAGLTAHSAGKTSLERGRAAKKRPQLKSVGVP